jgi:hypothetical protein
MLLDKNDRPIKSIYCQEDCRADYIVGIQGVTEITVALESEQFSEVPWFEIHAGDKIMARINAAYVTEVEYL